MDFVTIVYASAVIGFKITKLSQVTKHYQAGDICNLTEHCMDYTFSCRLFISPGTVLSDCKSPSMHNCMPGRASMGAITHYTGGSFIGKLRLRHACHAKKGWLA